MLYDTNQTIADFLAAAGAKQPTPGGGSVAALAGALAASMGQMVVNYSINKASLAAHRPRLEEALSQFLRAQALLVELMLEDQAAFEALSVAKKKSAGPGPSPGVIELAKECVAVPQTLAAMAAAIIELAGSIAPIVNPFLLSDLAVCADLSMAVVRCAKHNVRANLSDLSTDDAAHAAREIDQVMQHALAAVTKASDAIAAAGGTNA